MEVNYINEAAIRASKELADEIDFNLLADMYKNMGWTEISFNPKMSDVDAWHIKRWLDDNCKGHRTSRGRRFLFENDSDAINFTLRWK